MKKSFSIFIVGVLFMLISLFFMETTFVQAESLFIGEIEELENVTISEEIIDEN